LTENGAQQYKQLSRRPLPKKLKNSRIKGVRMMPRIREIVFVGVILVISLGAIPQSVNAQGRVSIGVTETMETFNPYGDTVSLMFGVWCQVMGCLGTFDFSKGEYVGMLAERWEVNDPNNWVFYLRKNIKFHDGSPLTAADVVHSFNRMKNDPHSKQIQYGAPIASVTAINDYTVRFTTHKPTAPLLEYLFDRFAVTSKAIYDKYGAEVADRQYPFGAGPYKFRELIPGQRLVIAKNLDYPGMKDKKQVPDEIVFRIMREPEQRVTALLNGEIQ